MNLYGFRSLSPKTKRIHMVFDNDDEKPYEFTGFLRLQHISRAQQKGPRRTPSAALSMAGAVRRLSFGIEGLQGTLPKSEAGTWSLSPSLRLCLSGPLFPPPKAYTFIPFFLFLLLSFLFLFFVFFFQFVCFYSIDYCLLFIFHIFDFWAFYGPLVAAIVLVAKNSVERLIGRYIYPRFCLICKKKV